MGDWFPPYVSVAERRRRAAATGARLRSEGVALQPVVIDGRHIARTFWGKAWCDHLESFSDFANRLPRGRTYVRNGSVFHLEIRRGTVAARVQGSELYDVLVTIGPLSPKGWTGIKDRCTGQIGSVLDLLQGKLSDPVMRVVTDRERGLFPQPREIHLRCSCPDRAKMCKHIAAVLYGVGARLDRQPELLFLLRGVDHEELIGAHAEAAVSEAVSRQGLSASRRIPESELADIFGVELTGDAPPSTATQKASARKPFKARAKKQTQRAKKRRSGR